MLKLYFANYFQVLTTQDKNISEDKHGHLCWLSINVRPKVWVSWTALNSFTGCLKKYTDASYASSSTTLLHMNFLYLARRYSVVKELFFLLEEVHSEASPKCIFMFLKRWVRTAAGRKMVVKTLRSFSGFSCAARLQQPPSLL